MTIYYSLTFALLVLEVCVLFFIRMERLLTCTILDVDLLHLGGNVHKHSILLWTCLLKWLPATPPFAMAPRHDKGIHYFSCCKWLSLVIFWKRVLIFHLDRLPRLSIPLRLSLRKYFSGLYQVWMVYSHRMDIRFIFLLFIGMNMMGYSGIQWV